MRIKQVNNRRTFEWYLAPKTGSINVWDSGEERCLDLTELYLAGHMCLLSS